MCIIEVKVVPSSKKFKIVMDDSKERIKIYLTEPPEKNKANKELLKKLKNIFKCEVKLLRGHTSSKKVIEIDKDCSSVFELLSRRGE